MNHECIIPMSVLPESDDEKESIGVDDPELVLECEVVRAEPYLGETAERVYQANEIVNTTEMNEESLSGLPIVSATTLHQPHLCPIVDGSIAAVGCSLSVSTLPEASDNQHTRLPSFVRPEFIFASALLEGTSVDDLGIALQSRPKRGTVLAGFSQDSPFLGSNLQPGDHVVAINNLCCANYSLDRVQDLIGASTTKLSICVHNRNGDPTLVSSSVMKTHPTSKVGIALKRRGDVIRIKLLTENSLFDDTLVTTRQRLVSINGLPCDGGQTAHSASAIIGAASHRVTIVSEIEESCAVTIALYERTAWWRQVAIGAGCAVVEAVNASILQP